MKILPLRHGIVCMSYFIEMLIYLQLGVYVALNLIKRGTNFIYILVEMKKRNKLKLFPLFTTEMGFARRFKLGGTSARHIQNVSIQY